MQFGEPAQLTVDPGAEEQDLRSQERLSVSAQPLVAHAAAETLVTRAGIEAAKEALDRQSIAGRKLANDGVHGDALALL
jgi:hypothetical protein